jgi:N-6 DNA Methylase
MSIRHQVVDDSRPLDERLRAYGCTDLIPLDKPLTDPSQIEYLDLLLRRSTASMAAVNAVAEHQGAALLYILDACGEAKAEATKIAQLQRQLANRSDPAWLAVARPGSLEIYPVGFHHTPSTVPFEVIREQDPAAPLFFQSLVHGTFEKDDDQIQGADYVFKKIYNLLTKTTDRYVGSGKEKPLIRPLDVLSMAGRALFFRFLIDRRIVLDIESQDICPSADGLKDAFNDAECAAQTSAWLDETFNGDFLRLIDESIPATNRAARQEAYHHFYKRIERLAGSQFFLHLEAILKGWSATGGGMQVELDWGDLDFAHIPVGVLSQVYESFSHRADHRIAQQTSIHYTPRIIARLMVDQTFAAAKHPSQAKVLDPACGAGIFLVLAFRRLVSERWKLEGKRPDTRTIQSILYNQIRGFEVSKSALRLAALALYITAIEVNGTPRPPKALKFPKNLLGQVLFYYGDDPATGAMIAPDRNKVHFSLGSLGLSVPAEFNQFFDIVIGNPPWTRLRENERQATKKELSSGVAARTETDTLNEEFTAIGRRVLRCRGLTELADNYENPDKNPDIPFVWRATEWAKVDGIIAFALPARVFGRTTGRGHKAWRALLRSISITGLISGADLRWSRVWEGVKIPFCLLFAKNAVPQRGHRFQYAAPVNEPSQNRQARFRIDYEAMQAISVERAEAQPWVLKALSLGTWLDVKVMERLLQAFPQTLEEMWRSWDLMGVRTGKGYAIAPELPQTPADFLADLKDFAPPENGFTIEIDKLASYFQNHGRRTAHRPRTEDLYLAPLVIIPQSPGDDPEMPRAFITPGALSFSQSYYGYSCEGHSESRTLAALLYLIPHSKLFSYFCLMTSRRTGFDRQTFNKEELDSLPFPDVSKLTEPDKSAIRSLARRLEGDLQKPWTEIDSFLFRLYGLDDYARQTADDTFFAAAPYRRQGQAALQRTTHEHREPFCIELRDILEPYFDVCGSKVLIEKPSNQPNIWEQPWFFLTISRSEESILLDANVLSEAMAEANRSSASRIIVRAPERRGLLLGLLNQRRWWTISRARLCGQHIIRQHLEAFGLS